MIRHSWEDNIKSWSHSLQSPLSMPRQYSSYPTWYNNARGWYGRWGMKYEIIIAGFRLYFCNDFYICSRAHLPGRIWFCNMSLWLWLEPQLSGFVYYMLTPHLFCYFNLSVWLKCGLWCIVWLLRIWEIWAPLSILYYQVKC